MYGFKSDRKRVGLMKIAVEKKRPNNLVDLLEEIIQEIWDNLPQAYRRFISFHASSHGSVY